MTYDKNNIFAKILRGEIPSQKIYEDDEVLAFNDIAKAAPTHVLVVPKGEFIDFDDFVTNEKPQKVANFFKKAAEIARSLNLRENSYRLISNKGSLSSQTVKHFHIHILGGRQLGGLLNE